MPLAQACAWGQGPFLYGSGHQAMGRALSGQLDACPRFPGSTGHRVPGRYQALVHPDLAGLEGGVGEGNLVPLILPPPRWRS